MPELTVGFVILRHVSSEENDKYWKHCYDCIRKYYPKNEIMIIDDNSDPKYLTPKSLYNTTIIQSEFPKRGELLPYLYYLKNPIADIVMMLHDSMFINEYIDITEVEHYQSLWDFEHLWDQIADERNMIQELDNDVLRNFYEVKDLWDGTFGSMTIITHDFLQKVNGLFDLHKLVDRITNRYNRKSFERVIGCILQLTKHKEDKLTSATPEDKNPAFFGNIHKYCEWKSSTFRNKDEFEHLPIVKIWSGR